MQVHVKLGREDCHERRVDLTNSHRPVRVCFMIDRLAAAGTETQLLALIRCLDRSNVQPFLCLLDGEDEQSKALELNDCTILRLGIRRLFRLLTVSKAWELSRFLKRERIDITQPYFPDSTYVGVLADLAGRAREHVLGRFTFTAQAKLYGKLFGDLIGVVEQGTKGTVLGPESRKPLAGAVDG